MRSLGHSFFQAVKRCRVWITSIFITYCLSCLIGIIMVHSGNEMALSHRDKIVGKALNADKASINYNKGNNFSAALFDFSANLFIGALPQTALGLSILLPYFSVMYQGWVGGIVSVDYNHLSRFSKPKPALYYIIVLILQYIPYSLAIGSGIRFGIETYKLNRNNSIRNFTFHKPAFRDILMVYVIVVPLFFIASLFEFTSSWNM